MNSGQEHIVLIVDDDTQCRKYHRKILDRSVFSLDIYEAEDVASADTAIRDLNPDLILMDIELPDGSGFEVVKKLRKDNPETPVIFITGFDDLEFLREARTLGAFAFFRKADLKMEVLLDAVDSALS